MVENLSQPPKRKNIRLKEYDYSKEGMYFITICTKNRACILSNIIKNEDCRGEVPPSHANTEIGKCIANTIKYLETKYLEMRIDEYVIMPNHIHMIVEITGRGGTLPLHKIIKELKTYTTKIYNIEKKTINQKLWQRNYYEHIIRNEKEYLMIKEYIINNPINWKKDKYF